MPVRRDSIGRAARLLAGLFRLSLSVSLAFSMSGSANAAATDTDASTCANAARQVGKGLDTLRRQGQVPAMGLAVFCERRRVIIEGYGEADADTPMRWGSITKSITGLAGLRLIETTDLTLDDPVRPILGDGYYLNPWAATQPVRIESLLALSAGLPDLTREEWNDNEPLPLWQALGRRQSERIALWPPGLQHSYSNVPPGLTAAVIERHSGIPFERFVAAKIFDPLGMTSASLHPLPGLPGGYQADGSTEIPYWHVTFRGFGALNASTRDMSRLVDTLVNNGRLDGKRVLPEDLIERFFTPQGSLGSAAGLEVGYGTGVYGWVRHGHLFHGHGGDADGYRSRYGILREHGRAYLLVINTDNARLLGRMRRMLEKTLTADLPAPASPVPRTDLLETYEGTYYPSSARFDRDSWRAGGEPHVSVRANGNALHVERDGEVVELKPAGNGRFFRAGDPAITVVFVPDGAGSLYLQGELGNFVRISPGPCPDFLPLCE